MKLVLNTHQSCNVEKTLIVEFNQSNLSTQIHIRGQLTDNHNQHINIIEAKVKWHLFLWVLKKIEMNRLIIVGNGFDKSLGMKTSYADFTEALFQDALEALTRSPRYSSALLEIQQLLGMHLSRVPDPLIIDKGFITNLTRKDYKLEFLSKYFRNIYDRYLENWVDCEGEYFEGIKRLKNGLHPTSLTEYNLEFKKFRDVFTDYLKSLTPIHPNSLIELAAKYDTQFAITESQMKAEDRAVVASLTNPKMENLVLNFNYTNFFKNVSDQFKHTEIDRHIHIHGELENPNNPIIFGFGDEHNPAYHQIEHLITADESEFIKSFNYAFNSNYAELIGFMDQGPFFVESFGHSLGLSDRTLLSEIVEHENLQSFHIRYFKESESKDNYFNLSVALSRHFKTKNRYRRIIRSKDRVKEMPSFI